MRARWEPFLAELLIWRAYGALGHRGTVAAHLRRTGVALRAAPAVLAERCAHLARALEAQQEELDRDRGRVRLLQEEIARLRRERP